MKTVEVKLFEYSELSDRAKEKVHYWLKSSDVFDFSELTDSLKKFTSTFPIKVKKYEFGSCSPFVDSQFMANDEIEALSGWRLATYIWNNYRNDIYTKKWYYRRNKQRRSKIKLVSQNCPFTGVCFDEDLLDPIWKFLKKPDGTTFGELLEDCLHSWVWACEKEWEYECSDEYCAETCEANEWFFTEDGDLWP